VVISSIVVYLYVWSIVIIWLALLSVGVCQLS